MSWILKTNGSENVGYDGLIQWRYKIHSNKKYTSHTCIYIPYAEISFAYTFQRCSNSRLETIDTSIFFESYLKLCTSIRNFLLRMYVHTYVSMTVFWKTCMCTRTRPILLSICFINYPCTVLLLAHYPYHITEVFCRITFSWLVIQKLTLCWKKLGSKYLSNLKEKGIEEALHWTCKQ